MRSTLNAISHGVRSTRCDDAFGAGGTPTTHLATSSPSASRQLMGRWLRVVRVVRLPASACSVASALAAVQPTKERMRSPRERCGSRARQGGGPGVDGLGGRCRPDEPGVATLPRNLELDAERCIAAKALACRARKVANAIERNAATRRQSNRPSCLAAVPAAVLGCSAVLDHVSSERRASSAWRLSISRGAVSRKPASGARGRGIGIGSGRDGTRRTWLVGGVAARDGGRLAH